MPSPLADRAMSELHKLFSQTVELQEFPDRQELWRALPGGGGVYAFCDADDRLILLASAQSLRRSIRHRLSAPAQDATPSKKADLAAVTRRVRWSRTYSLFESTLLYYRLARTLYPQDYRRLIAFGPAWFIHLDPQAPLPRFVPTNRVYQQPGRYWGPYPTRAQAADLIAQLEDLFDLCRHHEVLDKSPHGQACAYHEMNKCPAPCDGSIPLEAYKQQNLAPAHAFAWGQRADQIARWRRLMDAAAGNLAFERAALLKSRIERAQKPLPARHALARDADDFNYLVVQRAGGTSWVKPFFVSAGMIEAGQPTPIKTLPQLMQTWTATLADRRSRPPGSPPLFQQTEQVWLVSHFLFKGPSAPGCFLHQSQLTPPSHALQLLSDAFPPPPTRAAKAKLADREAAANIKPVPSSPTDRPAEETDDNTENCQPNPQ